MRDYINRLSRGNSIIKVPKLSCSEEQITMDIMCNTVATGSFICDATDKVYGMVYADNERVKILSEQFGGTHIITEYQVDASGLEENDEIEGTFTVVCNAGEKKIPFVFRCMKENQDDIRNHVKTEAVVLHIDNEENTIIHKDEAEQFECVLIKSGTEETEIDIYADADFIELEKGSLSTDDFAGDRAVIKYIVNPQKMHAGNNYGYIHIVSYTQHLKINVSVICKKADESEDFEVRREEKLAQYKLTKLYLDFRMKKIKKEKWIAESMQTVDRIRGIKGTDVFYDIVQIQLLMASGREETATQIYNNIKKDIVGRIGENVELYCYFLYVSTLIVREEEYTAQVLSQVKKFFENGYDTYRILWILFYLSTDSDNKSIRLVRIKDVINSGCISPVMYIEAMNIINAQPVLLRVLNQFEMQVINYGCRNDIISEKLAMQIADVVANEKNININTLIILKKIYDKYEKDEILTVLVTQMVRMGMTGENCFEIYEKGVLRGLKITRLYEFYMASIKKDIKVRIPRIVLLYFTYDSGINYEWKSFLYANVVYNKAFYKDIYDSYEQMIELYLYEQLKAGCINNDLMYLYRQFLKPQLINNETAEYAVKLRFMYRVTADCSKVKAVIVKCGYMKEPAIYEMTGNDIYIPLYISNCSMAFICTDGVIRRNTVNYEIEKILEEPLDITLLDEYDIEEPYIALFRADYCRKKHIYNADTPSIYKKAAMVKGVTYEYRQLINSWLIEYYKEYYEGETFNDEYSDLIKDGLHINTAQGLIEILLEYGMYYEARELMERYGYTIVPAGKMFKFIVHELTASVNKESYKDILCEYVFRNHLYNELVLEYMVDNYNGSDKDMYRLWKSASDFGVNIKNLSERVISQYMFTQDKDYYDKLTQVFTDYYNKGASQLIAKAYIAYNSFLYFIKGKNVSDITFTVVKECYKDKIGIPVICLAAWLKKVSENIKELNKPDIKDTAQKILDELCAKEIIYDYYKRFNGVLNIPYNACGVTVIEYYGNPDNKVVINYKVNDAKEYASAVMKCDNCGVFTYRLSLFYNDKVIYNYTIGTDTNTKEYNILYDNLNDGDNKGRFDAINECLASEELRDMVTLKKLMESYAVEDYVTKQLFVPENMRQ